MQTDPALSCVPPYPGRLLAAVVLCWYLVCSGLEIYDVKLGEQEVLEGRVVTKKAGTMYFGTPNWMVNGEARHFLTRLKADLKRMH